MPKKTININDDLDIRISEYIEKYNMTYTSFVNIACEKYLSSKEQSSKINKMVTDLFMKELEKLGQDIGEKIKWRSTSTKSNK